MLPAELIHGTLGGPRAKRQKTKVCRCMDGPAKVLYTFVPGKQLREGIAVIVKSQIAITIGISVGRKPKVDISSLILKEAL
jgi:hypothetical protein